MSWQKLNMKWAEEAGAVEGGENAQGELEEGQPDLENMTEQEKEAYLRKKAEEEGEAKDKKMKDEADSFTASLPRKGSYDYSQDQENKAWGYPERISPDINIKPAGP